MISVEDLSFQYSTGESPVLSKVTLVVPQGGYLALVGPSGSGKSTLCFTMNGIIPHSITGILSGNVVVDRLNTREHHVHELAEKVGIVLQNPESQLFAMSVEEELAFGPENLGLPREEILARIEDVLTIIGIADRGRFPFSLSGGEKQKLAIASILTMNPSHLVLDEPTSQLDPRGRKSVYDVLDKLHAGGMSIILIEHNTEHIAERAQQVLVIKDGSVVASGSPRDVFSQVETMKALGIQVPGVAEVTYELHRRGIIQRIAVTLEDAVSLLENLRPKEFTSQSLKTESTLTRVGSSSPSSRTEPAVEVKNLSFQYGDVPVLNNVSLTIGHGEIVAIIGQNGSGKTTLVKHFNGLLRPKEGDIFIFGESVKDKSVAQLARKVGYVFQNPDHQIFADSVFEEVEFGLKNLSVPLEERAERVAAVLKQTDLFRYKDTHPTSLSGGEKQRLVIASVLVMNPQILVLDEPTTGLDLKSSRSIIDLVRALHQQHRTVILVTHDMNLVAEMAHRILILKDGTLAAEGSPHQIFSDEGLLSDNFLEAPQIARLSSRLGYGTCLNIEEFLHKLEGTL
ncbi:MAG: ATP-binding cassette domain-containing protein [Theionarchaea archaeon]|nr:ATP-binding cassette domain-containing protein [Theionarchaea archaeon]MBU7038209.1 ATP-binding cassette domain-containing protein [Theionarchaea archaeon]